MSLKEPEKPIIAICIPHLHDHPVTLSWAIRFMEVCLHMAKAGISFRIFAEKGRADIAREREALVREALKSGATHILFWDDDIIPCRIDYSYEPNAPLILLAHHYPIVSALYASKKGEWCCYVRSGDMYKPVRDIVYYADAVGLGFCLIESWIFDEISKPWFEWIEDENGRIIRSEDLYFFDKVERELGLKVLIESRIRCRHIALVDIREPGFGVI